MADAGVARVAAADGDVDGEHLDRHLAEADPTSPGPGDASETVDVASGAGADADSSAPVAEPRR
ncbi:hypothetical protein [Agromyces silvae]|uniref:hypothetical protein n=1 Tax=Agromyces silvae TaxID=3388266 RepID=UPI00280C0719|nr:hypothetical protein [Agromyces protaetiae]